MHTEATVVHLETATQTLGSELRRFRKRTCSAFATVELPKEAAARGRKKQKAQMSSEQTKQANDHPSHSENGVSETVGEEASNTATDLKTSSTQSTKRPKMLNNSTFKLHSLGDYARMIRTHGTTDSYSTQSVGGNYIPVYHDCTELIFIANAG